MPSTGWSRYPKIAHTLSRTVDETNGTSEFIVTEKIHGANFSCIVPPRGSGGAEDVLYASRGGLIAASDNFFGFRSCGLAERLVPRVLSLRDTLTANGTAPADATVIIYGELCGGLYPHDDIPVQRGAAPVQRGCWYAPTLQYVGFDMALGSATGLQFLSFDVARAAAVAAGLLFATPLCRGALADCLAHPVRFESGLPATLGLPRIPENWAEGVVLRPARESAAGARASRGMLKIKIPEFSEKQYQNEGWRDARHGGKASGGGGAGGGPGEGWASAEASLRYEMLAAVNEQRLASVQSKRGFVDAADRQACRRVLDDLMCDVEEALIEDGLLPGEPGVLRRRHAELHCELECTARKLVVRYLRAQLLLRECDDAVAADDG